MSDLEPSARDPDGPAAPGEAESEPIPLGRRIQSMAQGWVRDVFDERPHLLMAFVVLGVLAITLYTRNPVRTNFIFDEQEALLANPYVRSVAEAQPKFGWFDAFRRDFWGLPPDRSIGSYRPVPNLVWRLLWKIGARQSPFLHHHVNVLLHTLCGALLVTIVYRWKRDRLAAWLTGAVFVSCALLTEAVSGVVGIADVLGALALVLAIAALSLPLWAMPVAVFAAVSLGLYSKETALCAVPIVPLAALLTARYDHRERPMAALRSFAALVASLGAFVAYVEARRRLFPVVLPPSFSIEANAHKPLAGRAFAALLRWYAQPVLPKDPINNPLADIDTPRRIAGALRVYFRGLLQIVFPYPLSGDYSAPQEPAPDRVVFPLSVLGGVAMLAPLLAAPVLALRAMLARRKSLKQGRGAFESTLDMTPIVALCLVWIVASYLPVSNIPIVLPTVRAERFWYFPVLASSILLGLFFAWVVRAFRRAPAMAAIGVAIPTAFLCVHAIAARRHANDYSDDLAFWNGTRIAAPRSAKAHLNYSVMLGARHDLEGRLTANRTALELAPDWPMANVYYGDTLCRLHRASEAWPHYQRGFVLAPNDVNLIALGVQCMWDEKILTPDATANVRAELEPLADQHPGTWLAYLVRDVIDNGETHGGVDPKYRPRGYNEGPKSRLGGSGFDGGVVRPVEGVKSWEYRMLDWMKGALGRKGSPLQKLLEKSFKDEQEKRELLEALAADANVKAIELLPLLIGDDVAIEQRMTTLFVTRADASAWTTLLGIAVDQPEARTTAMRTLSRARGDALAGPVDKLLKDPAPDRKRASWEVVMSLPSEVSDPYVDRALVEGPPPARVSALQRILKTRQPEDIRGKLVEAASDREPRLRRIAVEALAKLEGNEVFEAMLDRLALDDDAEIRKFAGSYLQKFIVSAPKEMRPSILGRLLLASDENVQEALIKALFSTGDVNELLMEILTFCKTVLGPQHARVMSALGKIGDSILDAGLRMLGHDDPDIRVQCLLLVEHFKGPRTVSVVVKLLQDADWWVRIMACETLGRLKDPRTLPALEKMLPDADCKWAAIDAIGAIGGETAFATIVSLLRDSAPEVRLAAVSAAKTLNDPRIVSYLEDTAKADATPEVRLRAVETVREINGGGAAVGTVTSQQLTRPIDKLLAYARESSASDLHLTPGEPPVLRINGVLTRIKSAVLSPAHVATLVDDVLDSVRKPILEKSGAVDFCYALPGVGRYRANVFRQQRGVSAAFRVIPNVAPTFAEIGLPKTCEELSTYHQGIVLVTGPAGAGKSTTLTALINLLNETRSTHVLSLEDPIEFLHAPKRALVNQREIGRDSKSFAAAMRGALREDPDVIVVGDLRDPETIRLALLAAETGHLVIGTMQTTGAVGTLDKLVESFPADEQHQVRIGLAGSLKLVIAQQLAPRADGKTRVAIYEVLKITAPIRAMIREAKTFQIANAMQIGRQQGMQTLDGALEEALAGGLISLETAHALAEKKETFEKRARAPDDPMRPAAPSIPGKDGKEAATAAPMPMARPATGSAIKPPGAATGPATGAAMKPQGAPAAAATGAAGPVKTPLEGTPTSTVRTAPQAAKPAAAPANPTATPKPPPAGTGSPKGGKP